MRSTFLGDLRPVQPETTPDLGVTVRREDELAAVDHRIARAVPLLLGGSVVLSKNGPQRHRLGKHQRSKHCDFHVSFSVGSAAAAQQGRPQL